MLGLINDLRDDRATIPAAALLRFVCLHFDHHGFVRLLKRAIRAAAFSNRSLEFEYVYESDIIWRPTTSKVKHLLS